MLIFFMKKFYFLIFIFFPIYSHAQSMVSIKDYINNRPKLDNISSSYVLTRCAAAYLYVSSVTQKSGGDMSAKFSQAYKKFAFKASDILIKNSNFSEQEATNNVMRNLSLMSKNYANDGNKNYAATGSYIMDTYISEDIKQCNNIKF